MFKLKFRAISFLMIFMSAGALAQHDEDNGNIDLKKATADFLNPKNWSRDWELGSIMSCARSSLYSKRMNQGQVKQLSEMISEMCSTGEPDSLQKISARCSKLRTSLTGKIGDPSKIRELVDSLKDSKGRTLLSQMMNPKIVCYRIAVKGDVSVGTGASGSLGFQLCQSSSGQNWIEFTPAGGHAVGVGAKATVNISKEQRDGLIKTLSLGEATIDYGHPMDKAAGFAILVAADFIYDNQVDPAGFGLGLGVGVAGSRDSSGISIPLIPLPPDNLRVLKAYPDCRK